MADYGSSSAMLSGARGPAALFGDLARIVYAHDDLDEVSHAVCVAAPILVNGCDSASLMVDRHGHLRTAAASHDVARQINEFECELGEGPCVDAIVDETPHLDADLTAGCAWPQLGARVLERTPVRGMAGFRVIIDDRKTGALNLFSETSGGFSSRSADDGAILAAFVSTALMAATAQEAAQTLREGLHSNREIGKAVGLMMAFHKVTDREAFELLRKASQDMNLRLADVAREVVRQQNARGR